MIMKITRPPVLLYWENIQVSKMFPVVCCYMEKNWANFFNFQCCALKYYSQLGLALPDELCWISKVPLK